MEGHAFLPFLDVESLPILKMSTAELAYCFSSWVGWLVIDPRKKEKKKPKPKHSNSNKTLKQTKTTTSIQKAQQ